MAGRIPTRKKKARPTWQRDQRLAAIELTAYRDKKGAHLGICVAFPPFQLPSVVFLERKKLPALIRSAMSFSLNLKIAQRLFLIILTFALPFALLLSLTIAGINHNLRFAQSELQGNRLLGPLTETLTVLLQEMGEPGEQLAPSSQTRASERGRNSSPSNNSRNNRATFSPAFEQSLQSISLAENDAVTALGLAPADFQASAFQGLGAKQLVARLQRLIREVGNASNLILDPDLDSYYLMDIGVAALPETQQRLGEALALLNQKRFTQEDQAELHLYGSLLAVGLERIDNGISTAIREDPNFYQTNPSLARRLLPAYQTYSENVRDLTQTLGVKHLNRKDRDQAVALNEKSLKSGLDLWKVNQQALDELLNQRIQAFDSQRARYLAASLGALAIASFLVWRIANEIVFRLDRAVKVAEQVSQGNLTIQVPEPQGNDEIAQLLSVLGTMVQSLRLLIGQAQSSGIQVSTSATELLATAKRQESTTQEQAKAAQQARQSVVEISAMTEQLTQTIAEVAAVSGETMALANEGQGSLSQMEHAMADMQQASETVSNKLHQISSKTESIAKVTSTIMKVADQTNLLSLNAAIEAEKAGEYGKGFATVAREVRRLADQTAVASLDIEHTVNEMNSSVGQGLMAMEGFIAKMNRNLSNVQAVSQQLAQIIQSVQVISPRFNEVNEAMQTQSGSALQMNNAVQSLADGMQFVTATLGETFLAIEGLNVAALDLQAQVSQFQVQGP
jgi:methyl-accepting chemotaxis protein